MSITKADATYNWHGMEIKQLFSPWQSAKLNEAKYVVIHNTPTVSHSNTSGAAQYALAQYNHNLGDVCVHYFVDAKETWHCLSDTTKGIHAADNYNPDGGNWKGIAIEIIEDETDEAAEDRGAMLAAALLVKNGLKITALKQHFDFNGKNCPIVIRPHWDKFKAQVSAYMKMFEQPTIKPDPIPEKQDYLVVVGGKMDKQHAEWCAERLRKKDENAYILKAGDVTQDGKITVEDARIVLREAIGLE